jgi:16S rRNA (uracil1498-N3)-methyltransferase
MPRVFFPVEENPRTIRITGEKAHYLATVLRCKEGEEIEVLDGKGHAYRAKISSMAKKEIVTEVLGILDRTTESPLNLILIQGILKSDKMDLVIQKTTELGISEIIPSVTQRSQVRITGKSDRWRRIAEDASRQSGRAAVPVIHETIAFTDIFSADPLRVRPAGGKGVLFWEEKGIALRSVMNDLKGCRSLVMAVGPEGGFSASEVEMAKQHDFLVATLGSRILRAETAAIAATALSQFNLGDVG